MTLEAWVNPAVLTAAGGRSCSRSRPGTSSTACTRTRARSRPNAQVFVAGSDRNVNGTAQVAAEHVDAPRRDLRRRQPPPLRERHAGGRDRADRARSRPRPARCASAATTSGREWFQGLIDEVRDLQPGAQRDRDPGRHGRERQHAGHVGADRPDRPRRDRARSGASTLNWTAATDDVGVARYNVHRGHDARLHAERRQPGRAADRARATPTAGLAAGTYYYRVTAEDAAGNVEPGLERGERARRPRTRRRRRSSVTAPAGGATVAGTTTVVGERDRQRRRRRRPVQARRREPRRRGRRARRTRSPGTRGRRPNGLAHADRGRARRLGQPDDLGARSRHGRQRPLTPPAGLVAGYGFDEGSGASVGDASRQRQHRHALRTRPGCPGKFGSGAQLRRQQRAGSPSPTRPAST